MNRTASAFCFSVERLYEETKELYFWTFTFRNVPESDDWALEQWDKFLKRWTYYGGRIHGLRVIELHKTHGMHFHVLLNKRYPIEKVLTMAWPLGFGRIEVHRVEEWEGGVKAMVDYLAAYLKKGYTKTHWIGRRRRWAAMGGFKPTRCKDIEYDTAFHRNKKLLYGEHQVDWKELSVLCGASNYGDFEDWPQQVQERWLERVRATHPHSERRTLAYLKYL